MNLHKNGLPCPSGPLRGGLRENHLSKNSSVHFQFLTVKTMASWPASHHLWVNLQYHQTLHLDRITKRFFHPLNPPGLGQGILTGFIWFGLRSYVKFTGQVSTMNSLIFQ